MWLSAIITIVIIAVVAGLLVWVLDRQTPDFELKWIARLAIILGAVIWICLILLRLAGVGI